MKRILLYEPEKTKSQHVALLLRVADLHCTIAESVDEVLNWLSTDHLKETRFDLLLLNSWPKLKERRVLFDELTGNLAIPIIYVLREGQYRPSLDDRKVSICLPENMLGCLNSHLGRPKISKDKEHGKTCAAANQLFTNEDGAVHCCSCLEIAKLNSHRPPIGRPSVSQHPSHSNKTEDKTVERISP